MEINDEMIKNSDNVTRCRILKGIITGENKYVGGSINANISNR